MHETIDDSYSHSMVIKVSITAEKIGFSRIGDNHWITQYEALFCVLNSKGQVATWRLTPWLSFVEVQDDLIALRDRLLSQGRYLNSSTSTTTAPGEKAYKLYLEITWLYALIFFMLWKELVTKSQNVICCDVSV